MAPINENIYHVHQFHLNTNFMSSPRRHLVPNRRARNIEIELDAAGATFNAAIQNDLEIEDGLHEVSLESENEIQCEKQTSIENDNFDIDNIKAFYNNRVSTGSIYPLGDIHSYEMDRGIPRKRIRQWSENDLYLPEMRKYHANKTAADVNELQKVLSDHDCKENIRDGGVILKDSIYPYMNRICEELNTHSQQINRITLDVQRLGKVRFVALLV